MVEAVGIVADIANFGSLAGIFALLKWGAYALFRRRDEPKAERPRFPDM